MSWLSFNDILAPLPVWNAAGISAGNNVRLTRKLLHPFRRRLDGVEQRVLGVSGPMFPRNDLAKSQG
jgi:hypothetical protein